MTKQENILLLYSGGLDSRLAAKILKEKGCNITAIFFRLPFSSDKSVQDNFLDSLGIPLKTFDCTKGELFKDFLSVLKNPRYGRGAGYNPCTDCKIFMTNKLTGYAERNHFSAIATGEVPGQRPMSQTSEKMRIIAEQTGIKLIRPLKNIGIEGRSRKRQMEMAKDYGIDYPSPGGGCLLCEKEFKSRFDKLIGNNILDEQHLPLIKIGRHFFIEDDLSWFVVGRNKDENDVIEEFTTTIISGKGKPAVFYYKNTEGSKSLAKELQEAYEYKNKEKIDYFTNWKI
jgi:tRNA U34 2-thiouridine synthase MnmA/TrmU